MTTATRSQEQDRIEREAARAAIGAVGPIGECGECGGVCFHHEAEAGVHDECREVAIRPMVKVIGLIGLAMTV